MTESNASHLVRAIEAPVVTGDAVDRFIGMKAEGAKQVRRIRQQMREGIGLREPSRLSLGRHGSVTIEPTPVFYLVQVRRRWDRSFVDKFTESYGRGGILKLLRSQLYRRAISSLESAVQSPAGDLEAYLAATVGQLMESDRDFSLFAKKLDNISRTVVARMGPEVSRRECRLVRFQHDTAEAAKEALVTVFNGQRHELRMMPARLLRNAGVVTEGSSFYWTRFQFSPDAEASVVTPAAFVRPRSSEGFQALTRRLRAAEEPLPAPSPRQAPRLAAGH